jgi:hypothetical protein
MAGEIPEATGAGKKGRSEIGGSDLPAGMARTTTRNRTTTTLLSPRGYARASRTPLLRAAALPSGLARSRLAHVPHSGLGLAAAREPVLSVFGGTVPHYVLSGRLFTEEFNIVHAGFVMDQPIIGKWLFWFSAMTMSSLPYASVVGRTID